jgi:hypothetical protein
VDNNGNRYQDILSQLSGGRPSDIAVRDIRYRHMCSNAIYTVAKTYVPDSAFIEHSRDRIHVTGYKCKGNSTIQYSNCL